MGFEIAGLPSISVDNGGVRELIRHLIITHGYRRFAYIKGTESSLDTIQRFDAFANTLAEYGIPLDPNRVVQGEYTYTSGAEAVRELFDVRKAGFDVLVACNDDMALGAMDEMKKRGIDIPREVAVVDFDNIDLGRYSSPSLTTIGYSIYELGRRAAEMLWDLFANKKVPLFEAIPTKIVIRESCGCCGQLGVDYALAGADGFKPYPPTGTTGDSVPESRMMTDKENIVARICAGSQGLFPDIKRIDITKVISALGNAFYQEINGAETGTFANIWSEILDSGLRIYKDISVWRTVISIFRNQWIPYAANRRILIAMEDIFGCRMY